MRVTRPKGPAATVVDGDLPRSPTPRQEADARCRDRSGVRSSSTSATRRPTGRVPRRQGARRGAQRAGRAVRRHGPGGVVAVRRPHQHADDGPAGRQRPDLHPVAHDGAVLAHPVDVPHRAQPPPERVRHDLRVVDRLPGLQLAHPARERHDGERPARRRVVDVLGGQEPQRPHRRVDDGGVEEELAARRRATTASTGSSAARPTTGIPTWPRTTTTSTSRTCPRTATTCPRTWPTRRCGSSATPSRPSPTSPGTCGSAPAPTTHRTTPPRSTSPSTRACSTTATRPTASGCCPA